MIAKISPEAAACLNHLRRKTDAVWKQSLQRSNEVEVMDLAILRGLAQAFLLETAT